MMWGPYGWSISPPHVPMVTSTISTPTTHAQGDEWESRKFYLFEREDLGGQVSVHIVSIHVCLYGYGCVWVGMYTHVHAHARP